MRTRLVIGLSWRLGIARPKLKLYGRPMKNNLRQLELSENEASAAKSDPTECRGREMEMMTHFRNWEGRF